MSAESVGQIGLDLVVNRNGFDRQMNSIASTAKKAAGVLAKAFAIKQIVNFGKQCLELGSDLAEVQNVVDVTFTSMNNKVNEFAKNAAMQFGLSETMAKKYTGTFGAMAKAFGFTEKEAYNMSTALTGLTGDVASFYNLSQEEAYTKLKSVFTGETESLKDLGVVMTQNALDQYALANGYGKTTQKMSEQEKVALRYAFVQKQLALATGDFERTQYSWANQTRILKLQFDSLKASIGQGLITALTPVIKVINSIMGKLVQLANTFKSFIESITGQSGDSGATNMNANMQDVALSTEDAEGATSGIADNTDKAAKNAKKLQKALMGFDEINKIDNQDDSDDDVSRSGGSIPDFGKVKMPDTTKEIKKASDLMNGLVAKIREIASLFKEGFKAGLGNDFEKSIQRTKEHILGIKYSLEDIFTDTKLISSVDNYVNSIVITLGKITGSATSIGQTIIENLFGGVDKYLNQNSGYIKEKIINIFDVKTDIANKLGDLSVTIADIFEVFRGDTAQQVTADLIGIFGNACLGIGEVLSRLGGAFVNLVVEPIVNNKDKIKEAIENTLKPISTILSTLNTSIKETFSKISEVFTNDLEPVFNRITTATSELFSDILNVYNTYIAPFLQNIADKFSEMWSEYIQPAINSIINFISKLANAISYLYANFIKPVVDWLIQTLVPILLPIIESLYNTVVGCIEGAISMISGFIDSISGLIDFIIGVFTGDWTTAWNGIKEIFSGIWNAIKGFLLYIWELISGIISTALNLIKGIIVGVWEAIKGATLYVWDAIKSFILSIWEGIQSGISSVIDAISSFLSGAWDGIKKVASTVWDGIKETVLAAVDGLKRGIDFAFNAIKNIIQGVWDVIKGIINSIIAGIEALANGVVWAVNKMIDALNCLSIDVPSWVPKIGGTKIGFDIPNIPEVSIPRLATGGYVKANTPQLAMIGDNKTQGEIVAPENKLFEVMTHALASYFSKLGPQSSYENGNSSGDLTVELHVSNNKIGEVMIQGFRNLEKKTGKKLINL